MTATVCEHGTVARQCLDAADEGREQSLQARLAAEAERDAAVARAEGLAERLATVEGERDAIVKARVEISARLAEAEVEVGRSWAARGRLEYAARALLASWGDTPPGNLPVDIQALRGALAEDAPAPPLVGAEDDSAPDPIFRPEPTCPHVAGHVALTDECPGCDYDPTLPAKMEAFRRRMSGEDIAPLAEAVRVLAGTLLAETCSCGGTGLYRFSHGQVTLVEPCRDEACRRRRAALAHPAVVSALALATGATPASGGEPRGAL